MSIASTHDTNVIFIGIAGPSGCGKSTYAKHLADLLQSPLYPIQLDHFFLDRPIIKHPILGSIKNCEEPDKITDYHREDNHNVKTDKQIIIIIEGFLLFALSDDITNLIDIKIFLDSPLSECRLRRYRRRNKIDQTISDENVIISKEFQQWFDHLVWNEYLKRRDLQISKADQIFHSNQYQQKQYKLLDDYILQHIYL